MFILDIMMVVFVGGWVVFAGVAMYAPDAMVRLFPSMTAMFPVPKAGGPDRYFLFWRMFCGFFLALGLFILACIWSGRLTFDLTAVSSWDITGNSRARS